MAKRKISKEAAEKRKRAKEVEERRQALILADLLKWKEDQEKKRKRTRPEDLVIYVPVHSFMPTDQKDWIVWLVRPDNDNKAGINHITALLGRYLAALDQEAAQRGAELTSIAQEITDKLDGLSMHLVANPQFEPDADRKDPGQVINTMPFLLGGPGGGIEGAYLSLARFLYGEHVHRLKRCLYCRGLFIAPDDRLHKYCPGTEHKDRYHQAERERTGYHRQDMAERRNQDSAKYDERYTRRDKG